ncbi:MAG: hypothetical protein ABH883_04610, partial [Candidatus Omnitrophota bacterium]
LGIIYSKLNRFENAAESIKKAIEIDKEYLEARMVLGIIYELQGQYFEAVDQYEDIKKFDSLNREANNRLAQLYYRMNLREKAMSRTGS